jgi:hypothetical protein
LSTVFSQGDTGGGRNDPATFEWPALLRKLDGIDPLHGEPGLRVRCTAPSRRKKP